MSEDGITAIVVVAIVFVVITLLIFKIGSDD